MYKKALDKSDIVGKDWTLSFGYNECTGGVTHGETNDPKTPYGPNPGGKNINFTCASAVMWNINFKRNSDGYSTYGHVGPTPVPEKDRHALYAKLVERFEVNTFMVSLVAVVNGGTKAREKHYLGSENKLNYHTSDFVNYLINKGVGVVVEGPVYLNTYHGWEGPSICQAYQWYSPSILKEGALVEGTGGIWGLENVPKWLHQSEINKANVGGWSGLLNTMIGPSDRFSSAKRIWNTAMKKAGIKIDDDASAEPTTNKKWKKVS